VNKIKVLKQNLKGHEFVVRLWSPGIYLNAIFESNNQELDSFIFHCNTKYTMLPTDHYTVNTAHHDLDRSISSNVPIRVLTLEAPIRIL